jgi:hypothetical protein
MANVSFKKGLLASLPSTKVEGTFYVTTDERAIYLDVDSNTRIRVGDFQEFATLTALQSNANPSTSALYYISDVNCLAKWDGSQYIQINTDTGATSAEVTGSGNAVTAVSYDPVTRKITLTKGATYATESDVDNKVTAAVGDLGDSATVKAYVDARTSGIATDTALSSLTDRVTTAEGEIDALQEAVGDGGSIDTRISNAIGALDKTDTPVSGQYVSGVSEEDGVITVTRESLPDYSNTYDTKGAAAQALTDAKAYADGKDAAIEEAKKAGTDAASAAATAQAAAEAAQASADTVAGTIGTVDEGKTVVEMIAAAKTAATYDDTSIKADIEANTNAIATLNGEDSGKSVRDISAEEVAKIVANADADYDTLKEIADWISSHKSDATAMNSAISALEAIVEGIGGDGEKATVVAYVSDAINALQIGDYAKAAELTALADRVGTLEGSTHTHSNKTVLDNITADNVSAWSAAEENAKSYADGLAKNYDTAGSASSAEANAKAYADGLAGNYDASGAADTAEANAKSYVGQEIAKLDKADSAVSGQYVAAVSEEDGVITVTRAELPDYSATYEAKGAAESALDNAKAYTDDALTWGSF